MIHKCDQCGQSFTENHNLTRHIQSKHAYVKYSCDKCNFQATRKDSLNRHIKERINQLTLRKSGEFFRAKILVKSSSSPDGPARGQRSKHWAEGK